MRGAHSSDHLGTSFKLLQLLVRELRGDFGRRWRAFEIAGRGQPLLDREPRLERREPAAVWLSEVRKATVKTVNLASWLILGSGYVAMCRSGGGFNGMARSAVCIWDISRVLARSASLSTFQRTHSLGDS